MSVPSLHSTAIADVAPPERLVRQGALVIGASLSIGLAAQVALPLPFTPVPATLQTFAVLLVGLVLGSRLGALAVLAYLGEGLVGLPVFAGGATGQSKLVGPTGGYLAGFVLAAFVVGLLAERGWTKRRLSTLGALLIGHAVIYTCGVTILAAFMPWRLALVQGVLPFLPGEAIKSAAVVSALPWAVARFGRAR